MSKRTTINCELCHSFLHTTRQHKNRKADVRFKTSNGWLRFEGRRTEQECIEEGRIRESKEWIKTWDKSSMQEFWNFIKQKRKEANKR